MHTFYLLYVTLAKQTCQNFSYIVFVNTKFGCTEREFVIKWIYPLSESMTQRSINDKERIEIPATIPPSQKQLYIIGIQMDRSVPQNKNQNRHRTDQEV